MKQNARAEPAKDQFLVVTNTSIATIIDASCVSEKISMIKFSLKILRRTLS